jgi:hypothetical protein
VSGATWHVETDPTRGSSTQPGGHGRTLGPYRKGTYGAVTTPGRDCWERPDGVAEPSLPRRRQQHSRRDGGLKRVPPPAFEAMAREEGDTSERMRPRKVGGKAPS